MTTANPLLFNHKPFAIGIGPQRCGELWIDTYLRARGDVALPDKQQEIFFFDRLYERGIEFYADQFKPKPSDRLIVEITTTLFDTDHAPARLHEHFGHAPIIICPIRHPISRSYSLYKHYLSYGLVHGSLREACFQNPHILQSSNYSRHLRNWIETFGQNKIQLLFQEQLERNPEQYTHALCLALDLEPKPTNPTKSSYINAPESHKGRFFTHLEPDTGLKGILRDDLEWLKDQIGEQVDETEKLLGCKIQYWHEPLMH